MNTDEPTKDLKDPAEYETKPVLDLILERVTAIGDELTAFRAELQQFKENTERNFDRVNNSLEIIANDLLKIRTEYFRA